MKRSILLLLALAPVLFTVNSQAAGTARVSGIEAFLIYASTGQTSRAIEKDASLVNTVIGEGFAAGGGPSNQTLIKVQVQGPPESDLSGNLEVLIEKEKYVGLQGKKLERLQLLSEKEDYGEPLSSSEVKELGSLYEEQNRLQDKGPSYETVSKFDQRLGITGSNGLWFGLFVAQNTGCHQVRIRTRLRYSEGSYSGWTNRVLDFECGNY